MNRTQPAPTKLPVASTRPRRSWSFLWLIPLFALALASWLLASALGQRGIPITIELQEGHGLKPGDALRYRGIAVGQVRQVRLSDDLGTIQVEVLLDRSAQDLARSGSRFWVVRPQVDISGATGLKTIIGANYLGVIPGQGDSQSQFIGLQDPPLLAVMDAGGLEITLLTAGKGNLRAGAPISYRQVLVGKILSVDLTKDASAVQARAYIRPEYTSLIRSNTRFWKVSGARLSAGLTGISLDVESLGGLILGGVTLAIPANPGPPVHQSQRFTLYEEPQSEWLEWIPFLAIDSAGKGLSEARPQPLPALLTWQRKTYLYLTVDKQRRGWVLPVAGGIMGPDDLLTHPQEALEASVKLTIGGHTVELAETRAMAPGLMFLPMQHQLPAWPEERRRTITEAEDSLLVANPERPLRFISAEHLQTDTALWDIDPKVPFDASWHGASVVSDRDGKLIGMLLVHDQEARIARFVALPDQTAGAQSREQREVEQTWWEAMLGLFSSD